MVEDVRGEVGGHAVDTRAFLIRLVGEEGLIELLDAVELAGDIVEDAAAAEAVRYRMAPRRCSCTSKPWGLLSFIH